MKTAFLLFQIIFDILVIFYIVSNWRSKNNGE